LGYYHPPIAHFAIALLIVGVLFRAASLLRRPAFLDPAALTLLALGTIAALVAVQSGDAAHGPVERIPGVRPAVVEHEEWGERTRNVFLVVIALEAVGLALRRSEKRRVVLIASTIVGVVGLGALYATGSHGGDLVYRYAGGVGIRSGDPADVERLLLAGLYQQAQVDRRAGRPAEANALLVQAARRFPKEIDQTIPKVMQFLLIIEVRIIIYLQKNCLSKFINLKTKFEVGRIFYILFIFREKFKSCEMVSSVRCLPGLVFLVVPEKSKYLIAVVDIHIICKPFG